ncbi:MAG TPA: serine hydrolase domain-containing protein [Thermoanaerobaculia bacterium]
MSANRRLPLLLLVLFTSMVVPAAFAQTPKGWPELVREFDAYVATDKVVGGSILYLRDGKVVAQHNVGHADLAAKRLVDDETIFHWGSITKMLTAIAILQLRDEGRLTLDDKVVRYIPELRRVHDPYGKLEEITIRMLLNHTAGFQAPTWPYDKGLPWEPFEPTEWAQLVAMMPYEQLLFPPGEKYGYSNPAYVYLGRIIEQLSGDPWDAYVYKNIFLPLGLHRSYFRKTPISLRRYRSRHYALEKDEAGAFVHEDKGSDFDPGITTPNGGWNAPLGDVARFVAFLTGKPGNDSVLSRASVEEMRQPGPLMKEDQWMGLSTFVIKEGQTTLLGHTGGQGYYSGYLYFNPATSAAVIYAFNSEIGPSEPYMALRKRVYQFLLK